MPIKTLQKRLTQVGVIRLGAKVTTSNGKTRPDKLETLRFTSPSQPLINAIAAAYGGPVQPWESPTGPQWEVITAAKEIQVLVPPQSIDPNYELWGNGYRRRMCDGETERISNKPCMCTDARRDCKPTTRMSLMLADIPSLGTWKLESHGWNAAAELPMLAESIERAPQPIPARLEVQARQKKVYDPTQPPNKQIETRDFMVPVLHFDFVTPAQAFGGQIGAAAQQALSGQPQRAQVAIGAVADDGKVTAVEVVRLARFVRSISQLQELWKTANTDGVLTDEVKAVLTERAAELAAEAETQKPQPAQKPAPQPQKPQPVEEAVVAEVEPDTGDLWMRVQTLAGERGWNSAELEQQVYGLFKKTTDEMTGWDMEKFLAEHAKPAGVPS